MSNLAVDLGPGSAETADPGGGGTRETKRAVSVEDVSGQLVESSPRLQMDVIAAAFAEQLRGRPVLEGAGSVSLRAMAQDADRVAGILDDAVADDLAALVHRASQLSTGVGHYAETVPRW